MRKINYIALGFLCIIILMICVSGVAVVKLVQVRNDLDKIYQHPFSVSNAARTIQFHVASMHRDMKDVVLARSVEELNQAIQKVNVHERKALVQFDLISERFLGDKSQVNRTYKTFIDWRPIREEVIHLQKSGALEEAIAITKNKGALHVNELHRTVTALVIFANNKAGEFTQHALANEKQAILVVAVLATLAVLISMWIAYNVIKALRNGSHVAAKRDHLIDQNIMMATLDLDGTVVQATNALCRFVGTSKETLEGKTSDFFDNSDEKNSTVAKIWQTIRTGKTWTGEIKRYGDENNVLWARSSVIPNLDDQFNLVGYTNILEDSTSKRLSGMDALTKLYNRRRFDEIFPRALRLSDRNHTDLSLAIVDIDYFKKYNDTYGHMGGDQALSKVAAVLSSCLKRPNDYAFRIGGEEFALLFSDLNFDETEEFLMRVKKAVEDLGLEHIGSDVAGHVTISIGAYLKCSDEAVNEKQFYKLADEALYQAKSKRNSLVVHAQPELRALKVAQINPSPSNNR